ncbi:phage holin family protein [Nonomuraea cavernae]|uniref:Membrane protein n=1 Tax=Nonomuraea cavernae TaxID=2045107 RepID=A0A918DK90_9ACTN|nr:phage holin family protein [Nonomuraea cavernae]MCA2186270.1 phage holin family protein [Nonomuraea cavernae]GGO69692.1 membrane protein [Nonomuraea cavernae]
MPQTPEEESLGSLVAQASSHISTLVRSEIELAKAEFRFDAKRVGTAGGLFAAAAFMAHLCLILASFTIAYVLEQWLPTWASFLIVTVFYLLVAGLLVFVGIRRLKGLSGMRRTTQSIRDLKEIATPEEPTAGQVGLHREPVSRDGA